MWVEVTIFPFLDAVATVEVITTSNNEVNFVETQKPHILHDYEIVVSF